MEKAKLALITSEIKAQRANIDEIYRKIDERAQRIKTDDSAIIESLAYQLHNLYSAFEDLFKTVAMFFENSIEDIAKYHSELLKRMLISVEGIRPALIDKETFELLDNLRAFRHFFRHAYSYELKPEKIKIVLEEALKLKALYKKQVDNFLNQIKQ